MLAEFGEWMEWQSKPRNDLVPSILSIENATPELKISQDELFETFFAEFYSDVPQARAVFKNCRVDSRHLSWDPREAFSNGSPTTAERNFRWESVALEVSLRSATAALKGIDHERVGSLIFTSCTGYTGPGLDILLGEKLGLAETIRRTAIGHMGCYAAFNTIKTAMDSIAARPDELVLATCTELCTLHLRPEATLEQAVIHALFGDASASLVIGNAAPGVGVRLVRSHTRTVHGGTDMMTWKITDDGFRMTLSPFVPVILDQNITSFVDDLVAGAGITRADVKHWGVHPGGPKIVDLIGARLGLTDTQLAPAFEVLSRYGNCSSATILLVLEHILKHERPTPGEYGVLLAFGPGLTMEGLLVQF